ncbi:MAG: DUF1573 domain-containing protein [Brumimicrobium sp.]|nr:DUF1573 domain-containing protein [Brumimicrobium sp.]
MKKILICLFLIALVSCSGKGDNEMQVGQYTTIEVEEVYDAGTVAKGEIIKADIIIKNTGKYPLVIANIEPACSCTVSEYDEDPIDPGKTSIIKTEVDTDKTGKGKIMKPINITANTRPSTTTVTIKATVN